MIRDHMNYELPEIAFRVTTCLNQHHTTTIPPKVVQTTLPFTYETSRVRESFPTNSDTLSTVRSSQFDSVKDPFDR